MDDDHLVYRLRKPTLDGRTELILTPLELLDRLAYPVTPPRVHKHRHCGVLAPNAKLRKAMTATAGPAAPCGRDRSSSDRPGAAPRGLERRWRWGRRYRTGGESGAHRRRK